MFRKKFFILARMGSEVLRKSVGGPPGLVCEELRTILLLQSGGALPPRRVPKGFHFVENMKTSFLNSFSTWDSSEVSTPGLMSLLKGEIPAETGRRSETR
jgi:hypothetical protein